MKNVFALSALLALASVSATAQTITAAPSAMNFQGRLAKKDGTPVPDGVHTVTFRIYDAQTGGNVKWAEQIGSLNTKSGAFSAVLGKVFPFTDTILNGTVWLEIQVDTDAPLTPRQQFQSVAYALKANTVPDGAITTAKIADGAITANKLSLNIGGVPSGYCILGFTPSTPDGFTFNGDIISNNGAWATQTSAPVTLYGAGSAIVNNKLYLLGGNTTTTALNTAVYVYDLLTGTWGTALSMPTPRTYPVTAVINGKIHVLGGSTNSGGQGDLTVHEVYDPAFNTWATKAPVPSKMQNNSSAVVYNNQIFVIGGWNGSINTTNNYVYDDSNDTWTAKAPIPISCNGTATAIVGSTIYVIGGFLGNPPTTAAYATNQVYDIPTNTWTTKASMPTPRVNSAIAVVYGKIHVIGGANSSGATGVHEEYDPLSNTWRSRTAMPTPRSAMGFGVYNNSIYVIGGATNNTGVIFSVNEVYTPEKTYYVFVKQ